MPDEHNPIAENDLQAAVESVELHDPSELADELIGRYPPDQIAALLESASRTLSRAAAIALRRAGDGRHVDALLPALQSGDAELSRLAEDALWSIWMRDSGPEACQELAAALRDIREDRFLPAYSRLTNLVEAAPNFAEAHHQRGIAATFLEFYEVAAAAYQRALYLNPAHFAAAAGLANVAAQAGDLQGALRAYQRALRIHPRLEGAAEAVALIETALKRQAARHSA